MKKKPAPSTDATDLRRRAEERLEEKDKARRADAEDRMSASETQRLFHELQVHQIELEMQNEELRRARTEVEALLNQYTDLYDFAPIGYFTLDRDGTIRRANLTGARLVGIERARLLNRRFAFLISEADRSLFKAFLEKVFASRGKEICEVGIRNEEKSPPAPGRSDNGRFCERVERSVQIAVIASEDGQKCHAVMEDITDRKKTEEKIKEYSENLERMVEERTEELNRALFDSQEARDRIDGILKSVADGLIVTDLHNRVILMNRAAEDLLGVRLSDVIDRSIDYAFIDETLRERIRTTLEKREPGYQFDFELPGKDSDHPRIMRARTSVIKDKNGRHTGIITIIQDVTYEREVDRMKTDFLSTAAHELRTPLTSIEGFSELLMSRDDITEIEHTRFLSHINRQSRNLAAIISDLLDISRIESGRGVAMVKVSSDMKKIVKDAASYFESVSAVHRFALDFPAEPVELLIDPEKMEQVLGNIFSNAVKYSPGGGVIKIVGEISGDHYQVSVEDKGIGMTPEQAEKIFDKFYRVDSSNTAVPGTGLGMSIVKHIVEAHGGTVWVESEFGKGTTVRFTIPLKSNNG